MKTLLVRYRTHLDHADANARAIEAVFDEVAAKQPEGLRYAALRLPDGTFVHLAQVPGDGPSPLAEIDAFRAFQAGLRDRCSEPPVVQELELVGSYRVFR
jgi:hypothetical protein